MMISIEREKKERDLLMPFKIKIVVHVVSTATIRLCFTFVYLNKCYLKF